MGANFVRSPANPVVAVLPDQDAPAIEISETFDIQSELNDALAASLGTVPYGEGQRAILPQAPNQQIVSSTQKQSNHAGYAVAAPTDNEAPVAILFNAGGQKVDTAPIILLPGQVLRPNGLTDGKAKGGHFAGFKYGLPFGWLGGGTIRLIIFKTPDSDSHFVTHGGPGSESLFHQLTFPILAADVAPIAGDTNWPRQFPWINAKSRLKDDGTVVTTVTKQAGKARMSVRPTRTIFELECNGAGLAAPVTLTVLIHKDGAAIPVQTQIVFPAVAAGRNSIVEVVGGPLNTFAAADTVIEFINTDVAVQALFLRAYRYGVI